MAIALTMTINSFDSIVSLLLTILTSRYRPNHLNKCIMRRNNQVPDLERS